MLPGDRKWGQGSTQSNGLTGCLSRTRLSEDDNRVVLLNGLLDSFLACKSKQM